MCPHPITRPHNPLLIHNQEAPDDRNHRGQSSGHLQLNQERLTLNIALLILLHLSTA